jgi:hypothetical protein
MILSAVLYFLTQHAIWSFPLIVLAFAALGPLLTRLRSGGARIAFVVPGFLAAMANVFLGHFVNALYLNAFGVEGHAIIVHSEQTDSTLNDQYIWAYDAVLKTQDGQDVPFAFDTMSASIYPIRNEIMIPPEGQVFAVKYIPGFPRNVVILSDASAYGRDQQIAHDMAPVEKAAAQFAFSPANPQFRAEYREALQTFITKHAADADPTVIAEYRQKRDALSAQ